MTWLMRRVMLPCLACWATGGMANPAACRSGDMAQASTAAACAAWGQAALADAQALLADAGEATAANLLAAQAVEASGNLADALAHLDLAWRLALKTGQPLFVARVGERYATALLRASDPAKAVAVLPAALKALERLADHPQRPALGRSLLLSQASAWRRTGQFAQAKPLLAALARHHGAAGDNPRLLAALLNDLAICMEKTGQPDDAGPLYAEAARLVGIHGGANAAAIQANLESYQKSRGGLGRPPLVAVEGAGLRLPE